jgi:hypothetical protein
VPRKFLEEAFIATYGFDIHEVLGEARPALRSYRSSVRSFIPAFAKAEVVLHRHEFPAHPDNETYRIFAERVARTNYERRWKHTYRGPGIKAHLLAFLVLIIPKIGAASDLAIKIPNSKTQEWYLRSVNRSVDVFQDVLHRLGDENAAPITLANIDLDTGNRVKLRDYPLADQTYARLLKRLTSKPERSIPEALKRNIIDYFAGSETASDLHAEVSQHLMKLRAMEAIVDPK